VGPARFSRPVEPTANQKSVGLKRVSRLASNLEKRKRKKLGRVEPTGLQGLRCEFRPASKTATGGVDSRDSLLEQISSRIFGAAVLGVMERLVLSDAAWSG